MPVSIDTNTKGKEIAPGVTRKVVTLNHVMTAIVDFNNGPQELPDPPHTHPHEQITFVAEGELYVFIDGKKNHLKKGDLFSVPGGVPHCIQTLSRHVRLIDSFSPIREDFIR